MSNKFPGVRHAIKDSKHRYYTVPRVIPKFYRLTQITSAILAILLMVTAYWVRSLIGEVLMFATFVTIPLMWLIGCLLIRMACEFILVSFSINTHLGVIREMTARAQMPPPRPPSFGRPPAPPQPAPGMQPPARPSWP